MSNESNFLSHHERKRLEYLYSNFHYLNEREQLEYNYLLKKSQGVYEETEPLQQPEVAATEEVQGEIVEPIGDLPVYQSRSKKTRKKAVAATSDLPRTTEKDPRQADPQVDSSLFLAHYRWHGLYVCERPQQ